jgi:hypothetical protein
MSVLTNGSEKLLSSDQQTSKLEHRLQPQRLYSVSQLAEFTSLSTDLIRRLFVNEPGVLVIQRPRRGIRTYSTLRIPGWVAIAVFRRYTNGGQ